MSIKFGYACYISHEYIVQEVIAIEYLAAYAGYISLLTIISNNPKTYDSLYSAYSSIVEKHEHAFDIEDLSCRYYAYDDRLDKQVYIICTDKYFDEVYFSPQFVSFMIELD